MDEGVPVAAAPVECAVRGGDLLGEHAAADHRDPHIAGLGDLCLEQVGGHRERVVEGGGIDALGPDRSGVPVLVAGQAAEGFVDDRAVLGGEFPGVLDVVGDQCRWDGQAELGGELELGGLEPSTARSIHGAVTSRPDRAWRRTLSAVRHRTVRCPSSLTSNHQRGPVGTSCASAT
ncbi:hypothetical protein ACIPSA_51120 [Streptomyces sp. NPDC086549]|uniref:hypothetical protein n=1 Tax=Streptomyces sp. NPDC086549 TaxID=3365752 RepID=UPI0038049F06